MKRQQASPSYRRGRNRRGTATREAILDAAIDCLHNIGYAATSVEAVIAASGMGRGSVLNQFPTRLDLMVATGEAAMNRMIGQARASLAELPDPQARLLAMADIAWRCHNLPAGTAATEVLLASRWDKILAMRLRGVAEAAERNVDRMNLALARENCVADVSGFVIYARSVVASFRGLTIELMFNANREMILKSVEAAKANHLALCEHLRSGPDGTAEPISRD